jgi:hypothetical protein
MTIDLDLKTEVKFILLHHILLVMKIKYLKETMDRNSAVLLEKDVSSINFRAYFISNVFTFCSRIQRK